MTAVPLDHRVGHTEQSSPPLGYRDLGQPHPYRGECQSQRYRTGKTLWFSSSVSASPVRPWKQKHSSHCFNGTSHLASPISVTHMNGHDGQIDVIEQLIVVLHRHARREEHHQFLLAVLLQKREEQQKTFFRRTYDISLKTTQGQTQIWYQPTTHDQLLLIKEWDRWAVYLF